MKNINLVCVVGARPNFMKMAPLLRALQPYPHVHATLVHTGQHYDDKLSNVFFEELGIKEPEVHLDVGSGKHGIQTARIIERFEEVLEHTLTNGKPCDRVVVVGDVNSTMAAALTAAKLEIPVAHIEAGLRSFDRSMPEEINRIVTDSLSDMLFVSEPSGVENLLHEGHEEDEVHLVGNIMIDTLKCLLPKAQARNTLIQYGLRPDGYGVVTMHRPSNVDSPQKLALLIEVLIETSKQMPLVFPIHPRTKQRMEQFGLMEQINLADGIRQFPPLGYLDFLALTSQARVIVTDSGGLQEESTVLGIPCLTLRENTERPITIQEGTSTLVGDDPLMLRNYLGAVLDGSYKQGYQPALWDGHAADRIAAILAR